MIYVYTDGSVYERMKIGGSGVFIYDFKTEKEYRIRKGFRETTINRCEMHAAIIGLQSIKNKKRKVRLVSDSMYVVNMIKEKWIEKWKLIGLEGRQNEDLIRELEKEYNKFKIKPKFIHIKGHSKGKTLDQLGNIEADYLADYKSHKKYYLDKILK